MFYVLRGPRWPQDGHMMAPERPRTSRRAPETPPETSQDDPKIVTYIGVGHVLAILGRLGGLLGHLGPSWGPSWAVLGASWGLLGPSWGRLGPSWVCRALSALCSRFCLSLRRICFRPNGCLLERFYRRLARRNARKRLNKK